MRPPRPHWAVVLAVWLLVEAWLWLREHPFSLDLEAELERFLETPQGRFCAFLAARERKEGRDHGGD